MNPIANRKCDPSIQLSTAQQLLHWPKKESRQDKLGGFFDI